MASRSRDVVPHTPPAWQGGSGDFIKILQPDPHFGARVWGKSGESLAQKSSSLAFSVRILGFPLRFFVQRSVLLVGQKSLAPKSFRATMGGAPLPRTHSTPSPRAKTQHNPARTAYADRALPWSLGSSPTSPALGAKVWRKVWGKSLDFESLEQSLSFFYEISRTPLPGPYTNSIFCTNTSYIRHGTDEDYANKKITRVKKLIAFPDFFLKAFCTNTNTFARILSA